MKLSVIIPVYKVEMSLEKCVESVIRQDYHNLEVILVNDGSPDNCPAICNRLADGDRRISVVHKTNGGLSSARNAGIEVARGAYITFVDSDDTLHPGTLDLLMNTIATHPEYDILEYPILSHEGTARKGTWEMGEKHYVDMDEYWFSTKAYQHTYACNKIYKKSLFNEVRFPVGRTFEDVWTYPQLLKKAKTVATTDNGLYEYAYNQNGITAKAGKKELSSLLEAHCDIIGNERFSPTHPLFVQYYMHVVNIQLDVFRLGGKIMLPRCHRLPFSPLTVWNQKIKLFVINRLGIRILCQIHKSLKNHW